MPTQDWYPNLTGRVDSDTAHAIQTLYRGMYSLRNTAKQLNEKPSPKPDLQAISTALSAGGSNPLNITGLVGLLSQPQRATINIPSGGGLPGPNDPASQQGNLIIQNGRLYYYDTSTNPGVWTPVSDFLRSPLDFGAVGDGVAVDTAAVSDAITALGYLWLPAGYTFLTATQTVTVAKFVCFGAGALKLVAANNGDLLVLDGSGNAGGSFFQVLNVELDGNKAGQTSGTGATLRIRNGAYSSVVGCNIHDAYGDCFVGENFNTSAVADNLLIEGNKMRSPGRYGINLRRMGTSPSGPADCIVAFNYVINAATSGVALDTIANLSLLDNDLQGNAAALVTVGVNSYKAFMNLGLGDNWPIMSGNGSPEGVVTATIGSLYRRLDGGADQLLYLKDSGSGNTGWMAARDTTRLPLGNGDPEGVVTAGVGSIFQRLDGVSEVLYVKATGAGDTGWSPIRNGLYLKFGNGDPEGVVTAEVGALWQRTDATGQLYHKVSGSGNTGWSEVGAGVGVTSLNTLSGPLVLLGGEAVTITPATPNITIAAQQNEQLSAFGFLTGMTTSYADIGATILLDKNGVWVIIGNVTTLSDVASGGVGVQLLVGGVAQTGTLTANLTTATAGNTIEVSGSKIWLFNNTGSTVAKLQGKKFSAGGTASCQGSSNIVAIWLRP